MAFAVTFGSYTFTSDLTSIDWDDPTDIPTEKVPRRHGVFVNEEPTRGPRTIRLDGTFFKSTAALARAEMDSLAKNLNAGRQQLKLNADRYINCYKRDIRPRFVNDGAQTVIEYEVEFLADDPFWYDATQTDVSVTSGYGGWTHSNGGDELVYPLIDVTAAGGGSFNNATFTNSTTNKSWTYAGTVAAGAILQVDCANFTCENPDGTSDLANFSNTFLWLASGNNSLVFAYSGTAPASIRIRYNKRYDAPSWE